MYCTSSHLSRLNRLKIQSAGADSLPPLATVFGGVGGSVVLFFFIYQKCVTAYHFLSFVRVPCVARTLALGAPEVADAVRKAMRSRLSH